MTEIDGARAVTGGVDTHLDVHVAAVLDGIGGLLGVSSFPAAPDGYHRLLVWMSSFGALGAVGVEGTGAYGAGLSRFLRRAGVTVIEVDRPNRQARRKVGKSDPADAVEAARAAQSGRARGLAKTNDGAVEAIRVLVVARRSARNVRIKTLNQLRHLSFTAPDELREALKGLSPTALVTPLPPCGPDQTAIRSSSPPSSRYAPWPVGSGSSTTTSNTSTNSSPSSSKPPHPSC